MKDRKGQEGFTEVLGFEQELNGPEVISRAAKDELSKGGSSLNKGMEIGIVQYKLATESKVKRDLTVQNDKQALLITAPWFCLLDLL